jgi:hypothetical protein
LVVAVKVLLTLLSVMVTVAFGTRAPLGSFTVPRSEVEAD